MSAPLTFKKKNPKVVISTKFGNITIQFYTDVASRHVDSFLSLAKSDSTMERLFTASSPASSSKGETRSVRNRIEACMEPGDRASA